MQRRRCHLDSVLCEPGRQLEYRGSQIEMQFIGENHRARKGICANQIRY
jgi:hypothetical protein